MANVTVPSSAWIPVGCRGQIVEVGSVAYGAVATNPAAITVEVNGTAVDDLAFEITEGGAAGDTDVVRVHGIGTRFAVNPGDRLEFISNGAPDDGSVACTFHAVIERH
jgi:hypothetical protein